MLLTLMRHGQAQPYSSSDGGRELTDAGRLFTREIVRGLRAGGWLPGALVCSPLLRSQQTAQIILEHYPGLPLEVLREATESDGDALLREMSYLDLVDPVIVGHEPGISRLAAQLLGATGVLPFEEGAVAGLRIDGLPPRRPAELLFFAPPSFALALRELPL